MHFCTNPSGNLHPNVVSAGCRNSRSVRPCSGLYTRTSILIHLPGTRQASAGCWRGEAAASGVQPFAALFVSSYLIPRSSCGEILIFVIVASCSLLQGQGRGERLVVAPSVASDLTQKRLPQAMIHSCSSPHVCCRSKAAESAGRIPTGPRLATEMNV